MFQTCSPAPATDADGAAAPLPFRSGYRISLIEVLRHSHGWMRVSVLGPAVPAALRHGRPTLRVRVAQRALPATRPLGRVGKDGFVSDFRGSQNRKKALVPEPK